MRHVQHTLLAAVLCGSAYCDLQAQPLSHEVHAPTVTTNAARPAVGTLWIQAVGFGPNEIKAQRDAEVAAMETLLFQGIAGTQHSTPMVPEEAKSRAEHAEFYTAFFDKDGYRTFITQTAAVSGLTKIKKGGKKLETRLLVDINALRRHLEENKVIKKFGL